MEFPLAHDENGCPVEVPAVATGWLVRRHAGGRGRPGAVYDGDGRPLVVPLEATAAELKLYGCRAGAYRLDAVDSARRLLGVAAYTELRSDGFDDGEPVETGGRTDAAVAALARAVEAMQRVQAERERAQAERERAQAEMLARLIERLAPPLPIAPRNASEVVREYGEIQKHIRNLVPEAEDEGTRSALEVIASLAQQVVVAVMPIVQQKWGRAGNESAPESASGEVNEPAAIDSERRRVGRSLRASAGAERTTKRAETSGGEKAAREEMELSRETKAPPEDTKAGSGTLGEKKLAAVFALLTPDEALQVRRISERTPGPVLDQAMLALMGMTAEEAVAEIRRRFLVGGKVAGKRTPEQSEASVSNGATQDRGA